MAAAVEIIELRFRHGVIDVDRWNEQPIFLMHFVKAMHAGGRLFRNAAPILYYLMPAVRILALDFEQQIFDDLLFLVRRFRLRPIAAFLEFVTFVDDQGRSTAVIDNELRTVALGMRRRLISASPMI